MDEKQLLQLQAVCNNSLVSRSNHWLLLPGKRNNLQFTVGRRPLHSSSAGIGRGRIAGG
jgi:hypothetical protein